MKNQFSILEIMLEFIQKTNQTRNLKTSPKILESNRLSKVLLFKRKYLVLDFQSKLVFMSY